MLLAMVTLRHLLSNDRFDKGRKSSLANFLVTLTKQEGPAERSAAQHKEAVVPRFFFHVDDGRLVPDRVGTVLFGIGDAQAEAVSLAGAMLKELDGEFWIHGARWTLHVTDEQNRLLFSLHFQAEIPSGDVTFRP